MKSTLLKLLAVSMLAMGLAVGCATTSEQATEAAPAGSQAAAEQAINAAKASLAEAKKLGFEWTTGVNLLKDAQKAYDAGDYAKAEELANKAKKMGDGGVNQYYLNQAKFKIDEYKKMNNLSAEQQDLLKQAEEAYANSEGKKAYDLVMKIGAMSAAKMMSYTVMHGDNLWNIAKMPSTYGNPYEWPLIYKANAGKIHDPDLIYPGQVFAINQSPTQAEVDKAVDHAKHRGAWKLGEPTASDT
ncbi:MAG: LysM peptidoglycan-binding domain-containing protein [Gammaproteobacteria bacterium]